MTRQEAIKILDKYDLNFCDINGNPIPPQDLAEAFDMATKALEQEPKRGKWIPVSERLPEENGKYVVTENIYRVDDKKHEDSYYSRIEFAEFAYGEWQRANFIEVVAWIDLKPYKESDEQ